MQTILEMVGYFSSILVLVSLLMTSVVKFRVINGIGSLIFAVYALLIRSYPTAVLNFCLVAVDVYFLIKVLRQKTLLSVQPCSATDSAVAHFLGFYRADIAAHFPDWELLPELEAYLVYANANPVGLMLCRRQGDGTMEVMLDYSCPAYRDCSVGRFLYAYLAQAGVTRLIAQSAAPQHMHYLRRVGFQEEQGKFIKEL